MSDFVQFLLQSRIKTESTRREYLCSSSQSKIMEKNFDLAVKRECKICLCDLHLSAASCPCSPNTYACLRHAKHLCSCAWSEKIFLYRYTISELNILVEALEGKLSAVHKWARDDLELSLHSRVLRDSRPNSEANESKAKEHKTLDAYIMDCIGRSSIDSIKAEAKARARAMLMSQKEQKVKENKRESPVVANGDVETKSFSIADLTLESSDTSSVSTSSSDSEDL